MRLVCPNCDAEYEVDDAAIPRTGRDVQCSNCGHAWFEAHPDMADGEMAGGEMAGGGMAGCGADDLRPHAAPFGAAERLAEEDTGVSVAPAASDMSAQPGFEPVPDDDGLVRVVAQAKALTSSQTTSQTPVQTAASAGVRAPVPGMTGPVAPPVVEAAAATRNIDESVLAVLREEAAREVAARRAETPAPALETQTEMRLAPAAAPAAVSNAALAAHQVVSRLKGEPEAPAAPRPRRDLLPAIEEINSTLRASSARPEEDVAFQVAAEAAQTARNRFGRGFLTLVLLAVILLAFYILAPEIGDRVPALAGVAAAYVTGVDAARIWLDGQIRALIGMLRGLEGSLKG